MPTHPIVDIIFSKKSSLLLIAIFSIVFGYGCYMRVPHIDDAWLGEYTYWFSRMGYVKSEFFRGFMDYDKQLLVYHKLFIGQGAGFVLLFGLNLYVLKSISIFYLLVAIFILYKITTLLKIDVTVFLFSIVLFLANSIIQEYGFVYRPEIMLMCFGLATFFFLLKYLEDSNMTFLCVSALIAGMCVLIHLNGLIFLAAGCLLLLSEKKIKSSFLFGSIALLVSMLYFWDVIGHWDLFFKQLHNDPALDDSNFKWYNFFLNILNEQMRFFHSPREIFFSALFLFVLLCSWSYLRQHYKRLLIYLLSLVFFLALLAHGKTSKYLIYHLPYMALLTSLGLHSLLVERSRINAYKIFSLFLFLAFLGECFFTDLFNIAQSKTDQEASNKEIASIIPRHQKIIAPMRFIYGEIENYQIQSFDAYDNKWERAGKPSSFNIFDEAEKNDIGYIIFDEAKFINYDKRMNLRLNKNYSLLEEKNNCLVFKHMDTIVHYR